MYAHPLAISAKVMSFQVYLKQLQILYGFG